MASSICIHTSFHFSEPLPHYPLIVRAHIPCCMFAGQYTVANFLSCSGSQEGRKVWVGGGGGRGSKNLEEPDCGASNRGQQYGAFSFNARRGLISSFFGAFTALVYSCLHGFTYLSTCYCKLELKNVVNPGHANGCA